MEGWGGHGADFDADPALVPTASNPQAVSTKGFDLGDWLELRPDCHGEFDELIAKFADGQIVAEMMSDKGIHIGIYWDDGRYCDWWLTSKKKLRHNVEHGSDAPPRYTAAGVDRMPWLPDYSASGMEARQGQDGETGSIRKDDSPPGRPNPTPPLPIQTAGQ